MSNKKYIEWLEKAIANKYINHFEYSEFQDFQLIGNGAFGEVMQAYWKNKGCYVALKSFNNNKTTLRNIAKEIKLHKEVDFHSNIIRIFGITSEVTERETKIKGTPIEYSNLYERCWKYEPDERPSIQDVVSTLKKVISKQSEMEDLQNQNPAHSDSIDPLNNSNNSSIQVSFEEEGYDKLPRFLKL
ncbi:2164_t:CDS:2 [Funneliformis caledonium]|uniref:2164_t:CDS:1 n=1 Tax=Funneliformis caledonium TaxID=1117310 RepID=A0A9N8YYI6_9GLOM|nr:2164_t:CDS:2 [Funneliformis caledonium]